MSASGWQASLQGAALQALGRTRDWHERWGVLSLHGGEAMNSLFRYRLHLRHPELASDLRPMLGRELQVHLRMPTGPGAADSPPQRIISALVLRVEHRDARGGAPSAMLELRPWPCLAELRMDCRVYQDASVVDVLQRVLRPYGFAWETRLRAEHARLDYLVQFNQTDWAFVERLCARWGLHYHFEHDADGHRLVIADGVHALREQSMTTCARLHCRERAWRDDPSALHGVCHEAAVGVAGWHSLTQAECLGGDVHAWSTQACDASEADAGITRWRGEDGVERPRRELSAGPAQAGDDASSEARINRVRLRQARRGVALVRGHGALAGLAPARTVRLDLAALPPAPGDAPVYVVLDTHLRFDAGDPAHCAHVYVQFVAQSAGDALAPVPVPARARIPGTQTATVLDAPASAKARGLCTDAIGRLRVRLHWARADASASTCWLRMARPSAGTRHGSADWPRAGQEVLVDFYDGDADAPVCLGCVRNPDHPPPWPLPVASAVSGWRSHALPAAVANAPRAAANHLLFDDTPGALQAQLASVSHDSALHLGRHAPMDAHGGRRDDRGEGFELRTRAQAAVRAPRALLLVSAAVAVAADCILHPLRASQRLLREALRVREQTAVTHDARQRLPAGAAARLEGDMTGLAAPTDAADAASVTAGALVLRADAGLHAATPAAGLFAAATDLACSAARQLSAVAGRGLRMHAGQAVVLGASAQGLGLRAAQGDVQLDARDGTLHLHALDALALEAPHRGTQLRAGTRIVLLAGGQRVVLGGPGVEHVAAGAWAVHAARRDWSTPRDTAGK